MSIIYKVINFLYKNLDIYFGRDYLWFETKKRIFFKKLNHLLVYVLFCYLLLSSIQNVIIEKRALGIFSQNLFIDFYSKQNAIEYEKMFATIFIFFTLWFILFVLSFFIRKLHEMFYTNIWEISMFSALFLIWHNWNLWFQMEDYWFQNVLSWFLFFNTYLMVVSTLISVKNEDNDEEDLAFIENINTEIYLNKNRHIINDAIKERTELNELIDSLTVKKKTTSDFRGQLHHIPSVYDVDIKSKVDAIIGMKKQRLEDAKEDGITHLLYFGGNLLKLFPKETVTQNYILNFKRLLHFASYFIDTKYDPQETLIEMESRYKRTLVLQEAGSRQELHGLTEEGKLQALSKRFEKEFIYLDPWYSSRWYRGMSETQALWYTWWVSNQVPFVVKIFIIIKRFFMQYKLAKIKAKKRRSEIHFSDALYSFFGIKIKQEKFIIKYPDGYIGWVRGQPVFVKVGSPDFDPVLYATPEETPPKVHIQIYNTFKKMFIAIKSILLFFYNIITSWGSILFWKYAIFSSIYLPKKIFELIVWVFKRIFYFFKRKYLFMLRITMPLVNYLKNNIYYVIIVIKRFRIFYKRVQPAGPFTIYNPLSTLKKNYMNKSVLFFKKQQEIEKDRKLFSKLLKRTKKRKLFLLWSSYKRNNEKLK